MLVEVILLLVLLTYCCSKKYIRPSSPTRATGAMVQLEQASLQLDGAAGAGVSAAGFRTSANQHVPSSAAGHPGSAHEQSVAQPVQQPEASEAEHVPSSAAGHPGSAHEHSVAQPVQQPEASEAELLAGLE